MLLLVACVLALSVGWTSVAHAMEPVGRADTTIEMSVGQMDGEADQNVGDSGRATPNGHSGCHGHHVSTAPDAYASALRFSTTALTPPRSIAGLQRWGAGPPLRPPIA